LFERYVRTLTYSILAYAYPRALGVTDNDPGIDRIDDVHHGVSEGVNRVSSIAWVDDVNGRVGISACDNVSGVTRVG